MPGCEMVIPLNCGPPYILKGVALVIVLDYLGALEIGDQLLQVVTFRVSFPLDKVLQMFSPPLTLVAADGLDLVLFFIPHEVQGRSGVVCTVLLRFYIWGEEGGMEHRVDGPLRGKCQLVCHWGDHLCDLEGPMPPRCELN
jgi:hypothetical protein